MSKSLYRQLPDVREFVDSMWDENEPDVEKTNEITVSRTDPDCSIVTTMRNCTFLAHKVHLAVDAGQSDMPKPCTSRFRSCWANILSTAGKSLGK